jgi:hypothetical protein
MAKLKQDAITNVDLLEFLTGYSDFSFEAAASVPGEGVP